MKKVLILSSSPRRNGNSFLMAESALKGAQAAGHEAELLYIDDYLKHFLRDCRECRLENGECSLQDNYRDLFLNHYLPADGIIFATPLYWYGMSGQLKTFFDRSFCYYAASHPKSDEYAEAMCGKTLGLLIASEESYPAAPMGIIHSIQEFSRYTHSHFAGYVQGIGNKRGDVDEDPCDPILQAHQLGTTLFDRFYTDYKMDTPRKGSVWDNVES